MPAAQTGGGSATHSGTNYQNYVAAWIAARILAENGASPPWNLAASISLNFLRCETQEPVDDILVGTSQDGHIFIQAKHTISLGAADTSEFASVIDQFVRQFLAYPTAISSPQWARPLDSNRDRLVLATTSASSAPVCDDLAKVLARIRTLSPSQPLDDAAASANDRKVLTILQSHISHSWNALKGGQPTPADYRAIVALMWVHTLDVDPGEVQELAAKDLLRATVVKVPNETDLAWTQLVQACAQYAANHSGADRREFQKILVAAGINVQATRSYWDDISKLKQLSATSLTALSSLSEIRLSATQVVKIARPSTSDLRNAVLSRSLVVVGQPGAGKSGTLYDLARVLESDGDVIIFVVDQFDARSLGALRAEMGCTHEIVDILRNWPGTKPGFLIIDALDAARTDAAAAAFRNLIGFTLGEQGRWRVVPSIRKFDLRYSNELHAIFSGSPPSNFHDPEFKSVCHLEVPILSDDEISQVKQQSPEIGAVIEDAGADLKKLLRVPFNLRLIADLIRTGATVASLTPINTQVGLLERYWRERVISSDSFGDAREAVLRKAVAEMVSGRTLRINRAVLANDPAAAEPLHQVLSAQLLTEWQASPDRMADRYVITFAHHILFDYAATRLLFRGPTTTTVAWLASEPDLLVAVRPSLVYHFQFLWNIVTDRNPFWEFVFALQDSKELPLTGKIVGPLVASQLISNIADCAPLLTALCDEQSAHHVAAMEAFRHLMGAVHSGQNDPDRPIAGQKAPPWSELLKEASAI